MQTRIATGWERTHDRCLTAGLLAAVVVVVDLLLSYIINIRLLYRVTDVNLARNITSYHPQIRALCSFVLFVIYVVPERAHMASMGLCLRPEQGVWWWVRAAMLICAAVGVVAVVGFGVMNLAGYDVTALLTPLRLDQLIYSFVWAPLTEEITYRLVLCTLVVAAIGPTVAILVSGFAFAALHFVYGCPAPTNVIAGFFFAWAFLRSGSILVPVAIHSLGNMFVFGFQTAALHCIR